MNDSKGQATAAETATATDDPNHDGGPSRRPAAKTGTVDEGREGHKGQAGHEGQAGTEPVLAVRLLRGMSLATVTLLSCLLFAPLAPEFNSTTGLDISWIYVLNWAYTTGAAHGRDIFFTYGPWGFSSTDIYYPGTYAAKVIVNCLAATLFSLGFWAACVRYGLSRIGAAAALLTIMSLTRIVRQHDPFYFGLPVLLALLACRPALTQVRRFPRVGIDLACGGVAVLIAFAGQVKFSFMVTGIVGICIVTLLDWRARRFPTALVAFCVGTILLWLAAGQSLLTFPAWFRASLLVASGYDAMSGVAVGMDTRARLTFALISLASLLVLPLLAPATISRLGRAAILSTCAFVGWVALRAGLVRHDPGHEIILTRTVLLLALLLLPLVIGRRSNRSSSLEAIDEPGKWLRRGLSTTLVIAILCWSAIEVDGSLRRINPQLDLLRQVVGTFDRGRAGMARAVALASNPELNRRDYHEVQRRVMDYSRMPSVQGSVDQYGFSIVPLLTAGADYRPRPVFQSYVSYNAPLQQRNLDHLRAGKGPDVVLFTAEVFDKRFATQDDALVLPELLARYAPSDLFSTVVDTNVVPTLAMRRLDRPRSWSLGEKQSVQSRFGDDIPVPSTAKGPIWVTLNLSSNLRGRLMSKLLRPPIVELWVRTRSGAEQKCRLLPEVAASGFLLSPMIRNALDFGALYAPEMALGDAGNEVQSIRLALADGDNPTRWFSESVTASFQRLNMEPLPPEQWSIGSKFPIHLLRLAAGRQPDSQFNGDIMADPATGRITVAAHPLCSLRLDKPPGTHKASFSFGMREGAWEKAAATRFRVVGVTSTGEQRELWSTVVDVVRNPTQRRNLTAGMAIPQDIAWLNFRTEPVAGNAYGWAYWADLSFSAD